MTHERHFPAETTSVRAARRFVLSVLGDLDAEQLESVVLMVSELAANSVRHAASAFRLAIRRSPRDVRVEVTDEGARGVPLMRSPAPHEPSGRGLQIVQALSDEWGVTSLGGRGNTVWFSLVVPAA
jgi:anti-sigma regulatory factor (Ser/Thr protein kinase)